MIPAPSGLVARYRQEHDGKKMPPSVLPVVAFDDDGMPLIVARNESHRRLAPADCYGNYEGFGEDRYPPIVSLLPAGGWRVEYTADDGSSWSEPLIGWGLRANGDVVALNTDCDGWVSDFDHYGGKYRIYHPDAIAPPVERPSEASA